MLKKMMLPVPFAVILVGAALLLATQNRAAAEVSGMQHYQLYAHHAQDVQVPEVKTEGVVAGLKMEPAKFNAGMPVTITVSIQDSEGKPAAEIAPTHDRILHVIIVSEDFTIFSHIHPEDLGPVTPDMKKAAQFPVRYTFPKAGRYLIGVDFAVKEQSFSKRFVIDVAGDAKMGALTTDFSRAKRFGEYDVTLTSVPASVAAGKEVVLTYVIKKEGQSVSDLEPYLAATMHVAFISTDLNNFMHEHGMVPGMSAAHAHHMMHDMSIPLAFGPEIKVSTTFPAKGVYHIFSEVKHRGKVIVTHFMVEVE
jgi:hypothetical protein